MENDLIQKIEDWKKQKDEETFRAKMAEENAFWAANNEIIELYPRVRKLLDVADKCRECGVKLKGCYYSTSSNPYSYGLEPKKESEYDRKNSFCFFVKKAKDWDYTLTFSDKGAKLLSTSEAYRELDLQGYDIKAFELSSLVDAFKEFEERFYNQVNEAIAS